MTYSYANQPEPDELEEEPIDESVAEEEPHTPTGPPVPVIVERVGQATGSTLSHIGETFEPSPTREANGDDLSDLFKGPQLDDPDMRTDDLFEITEEDVFGDGGEDMSDILDVSDEDIMGEAPPPPVRIRRVIRTPRRRAPPISLGGVQY